MYLLVCHMFIKRVLYCITTENTKVSDMTNILYIIVYVCLIVNLSGGI